MAIEQRVTQLEKRCRQLTGVLMGVMAISGVIVLGGAAPNDDPKYLQSQKLEIVDGDGNVRIRLGKADAGYGVVIYDQNGRFNATLTDAPLGAVMSLSKNGSGMRLQAGKDGAGMSIHDTNGQPRAVVVVSDGGSQIVLKDQDQNTVFSASRSEQQDL